MDSTYIIKKPLITEKSTFAMNEDNRYTFLVDRRATKDDIKDAVQELYKVRVTNVTTQVCKGRRRRMRYGYVIEKPTKTARVRLHPDDAIELF